MSINNIVVIILALIISLMSLIIGVQHHHIAYLNNQFDMLNDKITALEVEAQNETERYKEAQEQANQDLAKDQVQTQDILLAKIPAECDDAIAWGIDEAKAFAT